MGKYKKVFMVAAFPPPVHGMSAVTHSVYTKLVDEGILVKKLDTSPATLDRMVLYRIARLIPLVKAWLSLLFISRKDSDAVLYIALSGGAGQVFDMLTILIGRIKGMKCVLHHHSYAYLHERSLLTKLLCKVSGRFVSTHIVLCESMKNALQKIYKVSNVVVLSNSGLVGVAKAKENKDYPLVLGYLSNITREKGAEIVIDLVYELKRRGSPVRVLMAGPCYDDMLTNKINDAASTGYLEWVGPVYGSKKDGFFEAVDLFVFPTQYGNEAEPLVLWESISAGIPVVAFGRGCISDQVGIAGLIVPQGENFVSAVIKFLDKLERRLQYQKLCQSVKERYSSALDSSDKSWVAFLKCLEV